jgi:hypothetical protein
MENTNILKKKYINILYIKFIKNLLRKFFENHGNGKNNFKNKHWS